MLNRRTKPAGLSDKEWEAWPWCKVPGCPNKCCLSLNSEYCHPHTGIGESYHEMMEKIKDKESVDV